MGGPTSGMLTTAAGKRLRARQSSCLSRVAATGPPRWRSARVAGNEKAWRQHSAGPGTSLERKAPRNCCRAFSYRWHRHTPRHRDQLVVEGTVNCTEDRLNAFHLIQLRHDLRRRLRTTTATPTPPTCSAAPRGHSKQRRAPLKNQATASFFSS